MNAAETSTLAREMGLSEQAAFLHSILEGSTEYAIIAKDPDGHIVGWNEGARRIYGYDAPDRLGHPEVGRTPRAAGRRDRPLDRPRGRRSLPCPVNGSSSSTTTRRT